MKIKFIITIVLYSFIISFISNSFIFIKQNLNSLYLLVPLFLFLIVFAGTFIVKTIRNRICLHGTVLLYAFCISMLLSMVYQILMAIKTISINYMLFVWSIAQCAGVLFVVFWVGIICVYLTSTQIGFKLRLLGLIFGTSIAILAFRLLELSIKKAITMPPNVASTYARSQYMKRYLIYEFVTIRIE